jgi:enoyl-CoA hydratase
VLTLPRTIVVVDATENSPQHGGTLSDEAYEHFACPGFTCTLDTNGIVTIIIDRPKKLNALTYEMHEALPRLWDAISSDPQVRVAVITGRGEAFCAGGDLSNTDHARAGGLNSSITAMEQSRALVYGMPACRKPIISAINGYAIGGGLAIALMADISIASNDARLNDGHTRLGLAAGDHAGLIWPLHMSFAQAKYYLLTSEFMTGSEAAQMGLVSKSVPADELMDEAYRVAVLLATGHQRAIQLTKFAMNQWLHAAKPAFEVSVALEALTVFGEEGAEISKGTKRLAGR